MNRAAQCVVLSVLVLPHIQPAWGAGAGALESGRAAVTAAESMSAGPVAPVVPADLSLARYRRESFLEDRAALMDAFARAREGAVPGAPVDPAAVRAVLDLAAFHLAHYLLPEGLSLLGAVAPETLPEDLAADWRALDLAMHVLRGDAVPDEARDLLAPGYAGWADQPLFVALDLVNKRDWVGASSHLHAAYLRLGAYPPPFIEAILPRLLEGAVEARLWKLGREIAEAFGQYPVLSDSPAFHFLLGLTAANSGDMLAAFDAYRRASEGDDDYAQRARLAIAEIGLQTGTLPLEDAREILEIVRNAWRGDRHELRALELLAQVDYDLGDEVSTLEVLSAISDHFPQTEAAGLARRRARAIIEDIYARGIDGEMPLADFLAAHRRITVDYRFEAGFAEQAERFADRFFDLGATAIAAREYEAAGNYLAVAQDLGMYPVAPERYDALRLKEAEALVAGGQFEAAFSVLSQGLSGSDPALHERFGLLRARVGAELDRPEEVLATTLARPSEDHLRLKAEALFEMGEWARAKEAYAALWHGQDRDFRFGDAVNLLLAAYRAGDAEMAVDLAQAFPDLTGTMHWAEIAKGLFSSAPAVLPLREGTARERVDAASEAVENLRAVAGGGGS